MAVRRVTGRAVQGIRTMARQYGEAAGHTNQNLGARLGAGQNWTGARQTWEDVATTTRPTGRGRRAQRAGDQPADRGRAQATDADAQGSEDLFRRLGEGGTELTEQERFARAAGQDTTGAFDTRAADLDPGTTPRGAGGVQTPGQDIGGRGRINPASPLAGRGAGGPAQDFRTRATTHLEQHGATTQGAPGVQAGERRVDPGGVPQGAGGAGALVRGDPGAARQDMGLGAVPEGGARFLGDDFDRKLTGLRKQVGQVDNMTGDALENFRGDFRRQFRMDNMQEMGLDTGALDQRITRARTADDFRNIIDEAGRQGAGVRDAYMQTYRTGRHRISDPVWANKVPQKGAAIGGTAWLVSSLSNRRGQQSNAELYGQAGMGAGMGPGF